MDQLFHLLPLIISASLLASCAWALLRSGRVREQILIFGFCVVSTAFCLLAALNSNLALVSRPRYGQLYWLVELFEQAFALALMVAILRWALKGKRQAALMSQIMASIFVVVVSAALSEGSVSLSSRWMTGFSRNMSFGVAILNFQVWGTVIAERVRSRETLLIAAGLGLLTTGKSLGHTIRLVGDPGGWVMAIGNLVVVATGILASVAWWYAVRPAPKPPQQNKETDLELIKAA